MLTPLRSLLDMPTRRPALVLAIAAVWLALSIVMAMRLRGQGAMEAMFDPDDPAAGALAAVLRDFHAADELLILIEADTPQAAERLGPAARTLAEALEHDPATAPLISHVHTGGIPQFEAFIAEIMVPGALYYLGQEQFEALLARLTPEPMTAELRQSAAMLAAPGPAAGALSRALAADPLRLREFLADHLRDTLPSGLNDLSGGVLHSSDGRAVLLRVGGTAPMSDVAFADVLMTQVQRVAAGVQQEGLGIAYAGGYAIAAHSYRATRSDMILSITGTLILLQIVFLVMVRPLWGLGLALAPVAIGITSALGLFGLLGRPLTPLIGVSGALLAGLGIDYSIHYLWHYAQHRGSGPPRRVLRATSRTLAAPLGCAAVTTVSGFVAVGVVSIPAMRDFALLGALGLLCVYAACLLVLPAALALRGRLASDTTSQRQTRVDCGGLLRVIARHERASIGIVLLLIVLCSASLWLGPRPGDPPLLGFEPDLGNMHPQPSEPLEAQVRIAERFGSVGAVVTVYLEAASDRALLRADHEVQRALHAADPEAQVAGMFGLASLLPDPADLEARRRRIEALDTERILRHFDAAVARSPFQPAALADYRSLLARILAPGPPPTIEVLRGYPQLAELVLPHTAGSSGQATRATAMTSVLLDEVLLDRDLRQRTVDGLRRALASVPEATLTGIDVVAHDTQAALHRTLTTTLSVAGILITASLAAQLRDLRAVLLCLIPPATALLAAAALLAITGMRLNMVSLMALPLLIGVGVDDGIFLLSLYRRRDLYPTRDALAHAMCTTAGALSATSVTTGVAFGSLLLTSTPALASLGALTAAGVFAALVASLGLLAPLLLQLADRRQP